MPNSPLSWEIESKKIWLKQLKAAPALDFSYFQHVSKLVTHDTENPVTTTVSVHKEVFSYERLVATSVMEATAFSLSVVDHGLDDSAIASISFMVARSTSPTPVK